MIKRFKGKETEALYNRKFVKRFSGFERQALKRPRILDSAETLQAQRALPSNWLEALKGDRKGQFSIASTISGEFVLFGMTAPVTLKLSTITRKGLDHE